MARKKRTRGGNSDFPLILLYFFSGVPALIYQTVWQRILVLHSGVGTVSVAIIVSAYMLGIGFGSAIGAAISRRVSPDRALLCFGLVELLIGGLAFISPSFLYDFLYLQHGQLYRELPQAAFLHTVVLLLPTTLMGLTLPLMTRALIVDSRDASIRISRLYGANTMGAAFGAVVAPWLLMPIIGARGAIVGGAIINLGVSLLAFWFRTLGATSVSASETVEPGTSPGFARDSRSVSVPFAGWLLLYFLSGLTAIGLEILWFRILDIAVKSTSFTFGTILGTYLFFLALGSLAGGPRARRTEHPLRAFLQIQCMLLIVSGLVIVCLVRLPADFPGLAWFNGYWASEEPFRPSMQEFATSVRLYVLQPVLLMGLPAVLMGYSFCLLQQGVQSDAASSGMRVGLLQAANILGCTLGSLLTGIVLLDLMGSMPSLRIVLSCGFVFGLVGLAVDKVRVRFCGLIVGLGILILLVPGNDQFWLRLHGQSRQAEAKIAEDVTGVCMLAPRADSGQWWLWASGKTQSLLPFGGFHAKLGAIPVTLHAAPRSVAIIGLGSGDTAWAAGCRPETESVRVFEICTPEIELLSSRFARGQWPQLDSFLNDPRVSIQGVDARFALMTEDTAYDIIEADAIRHHGAFAGYLYSLEFFQLCSRRLKPGGFMCSWSPTPTVNTTFRRAFPHVLELEGGLLLIGSNEPIETDVAQWEVRLRAATSYLSSGVVEDCLRSIAGARSSAPVAKDSFTNTDLFPFDEFN